MPRPHPAEAAPRKYLVIGATGTIGAAVADRLHAGGAYVAATGRRTPVPPSAGSERWKGLALDVRDPEAIYDTVAEASSWMAGLDAVAYCPGVAHVGSIEGMGAEEWDEIFQVNVRGFGMAVAAALPYWRGSSGAAVAVSSQAARRGQALIGPYSASKAALDGLIRALAIELAPRVRVNAVAPGIVMSDMIAEDFRRQADREKVSSDVIRARTIERIPTGRFQEAASIAAAFAFLVDGEASRDITGQILSVDGGMTA